MDKFDDNLFVESCVDTILCYLDTKNFSPEMKNNLVTFFTEEATPSEVLQFIFEETINNNNVKETSNYLTESSNLVEGIKPYIIQEISNKQKKLDLQNSITTGMNRLKTLEREMRYELRQKKKAGASVDVLNGIKQLYRKKKESKQLDINIKRYELRKLGIIGPLFDPTYNKRINELKKKKEIVDSHVNRMDNYIKGEIEKAKGRGLTGFAKKIFSKKGLMTAGALAVAAGIAYWAYKKYKEKQARETGCDKYSGMARKDCILNYKVDAINSQIEALRNGLSACEQSTDPKKCKEIVDKKIKKLQDKIRRLEKPYVF